ncbi:SIR2 family protein [Streptomyces sp. NPDC059690]|uniref:SIR2 family protein n=1 Tax=Streptomyces sp. NPDC059690 TaxID=3346907 RepID=UPI00369A8BBF
MSAHLRSEIVDAIRSRNAVFIIGAGVSIMASGNNPTASWSGLISHGVNRCYDLNSTIDRKWVRDSVKALKDSSSMVRVAQDVEEHLKKVPGDQYRKWLAQSAGNLPMVNPGILEVLTSSKVPLLTTNYDDLLDRYSGRQATAWDRLPEIQAEMRDPGRHIVHLHGHWQRPETVIFGYKSYSEILGEQAFQAIIRAIASFKSIVFIGFGLGLTDTNFTSLTTWLTSVLRTTSVAPVMLVREKDYKDLFARCLPLGISVISYGKEYEDLEVYLDEIVKEARGPIVGGTGTVFGWDFVGPTLKRLHRRISRTFAPDLVVSTTGPGNFTPSHYLDNFSEDVPLLPAVRLPRRAVRSRQNISFQKIADANGWIQCESDEWDIYIPNLIQHFPADTRILLFNDEVTGENSQAVVADALRSLRYEVKRAALVVSASLAGEVDFYEKIVTGDFVFPW